MVFSSCEHTLENGKVRDHTTSIEVLETVEDKMISSISNLQVTVARVDGPCAPVSDTPSLRIVGMYCTSDNVVILNDQLLNSHFLLIGTDNVGSSRP